MWACDGHLALVVSLLGALAVVSGGGGGGEEASEEDVGMPNDFLRSGSQAKGESGGRGRQERPRPPFLDTLQSRSEEEVADAEAPGAGQESMAKQSVLSSHALLPLHQHLFFQEQSPETPINCHCDTPDCQANGRLSCLSLGMCYTQLLHLYDGSPPITRGCIMGETPLLCENRRPKNPGPYPHLSCCRTHYCNAAPSALHNITTRGMSPQGTQMHGHGADVRPGGPGSERPHDQGQPTTTVQRHAKGSSPATTASPLHSHTHDAFLLRTKAKHRGKDGGEEKGISPVATAFLASGAASVVVISAIGYYFLRRERGELAPKNSAAVVGVVGEGRPSGGEAIEEKLLGVGVAVVAVPERESWC